MIDEPSGSANAHLTLFINFNFSSVNFFFNFMKKVYLGNVIELLRGKQGK